MSRFHSYINTAKTIIESFNGEKPFAVFLKQFFAANKKYGSKDRKQIASLCYDYFRLGYSAADMDLEERMLLSTFLCESTPSELMEKLKPDWNSNITLPLNVKLSVVKSSFAVIDIFPFTDQLSNGINLEEFATSFILKPDLFIRIRPQAKQIVLKKLSKSKLSYQLANDDCVQLQPTTNVEDYFEVDKEVVIQDLNSQKVLDFLKLDDVQNAFTFTKHKPAIAAWDCCAASGGKSILLKDIFQNRVELTISDIRASIVLNLHLRFKRAGIKEYKYFITDISQADFTPVSSDYDLVICDAPCTGSGTWSRTPEQLVNFKKEKVATYSELQKRIITQVIPHLQTGGLLVYITCSVFREENEANVDYILNNFTCSLLHQELLAGYTKKADTLFVAVFRKS